MITLFASLAPWLAALMAVLIVIDARQTLRLLGAGWRERNRFIVRIYIDHGFPGVRWYFAACMGLLAGWWALTWWLGWPGLFTLSLQIPLAFELYCVAGNFKRNITPW